MARIRVHDERGPKAYHFDPEGMTRKDFVEMLPSIEEMTDKLAAFTEAMILDVEDAADSFREWIIDYLFEEVS